ncbi:hypothetical protein PHYC_00858 [Phycisphaerales bacterium]|nr:hypothetical protein PHYC_00858 [Phycisphaerales bacterium]
MSALSNTIQTAVHEASAGRPDKAKDLLRRLLQRSPTDPAVLKALAEVHASLGEREQAALFIRRAAAGSPRDVGLRFQAGEMLLGLGRAKEAEAEFAECNRLAPGELAPYNRRVRALLALGQDDRAGEVSERSITLMPDRVEAYWQWFSLLAKIGRIEEAVAVCRRGLARLPDNPDLLEYLCYLLNYAERVDPHEHLGLHRRLGEIITRMVPAAAPFTNDRISDRPLRVAFLSGDICAHACAFFLAGVIGNLDRNRVTPVLYANNPPDATTINFGGIALLRHVNDLSDDQLSSLVRQDAIDILVECNGWTGRHRLRAVARRLAPVQVTYLGYPNTTGLAAVDARIVDGFTDPPGAEAWATERLVRLPGCFLTYTIPAQAPPPRSSGYVERGEGGPTFVSFNRVTKMTPGLLGLWARVVRETPGSRLLFKTDALPGAEREARRKWEHAGGEPGALAFTPFEPDPARHLAAYSMGDVALDPFPYNGTTSTLEALQMGVPVVSLVGDQHRSRVGASLLSAVGLADLIARDEKDYIRLARELAGDRARLAALHATLRDRLVSSPVCDGASYARRFEDALAALWRNWCERSGA